MTIERFNSNLFLTTSQVADLLQVHPSTVKRWCNDGEMRFDKTDGGHRRIHLNDALGFARDREISTFLEAFQPFESHVWSAMNQIVEDGSFHRMHSLAMGWLLRGYVDRVQELFFAAGRHPQVSFEDFCDQGIAGFMRMVGESWRSGQLRVAEEHMVTEAVVEVLFALRRELPPHPAAHTADGPPPPVAVLGAMEGDRHNLGALCIRLALHRMGWKVFYLGADVPVEDFAAMQKGQNADLVAVAFAPPNTGADMKRCVRILSEFYDPSHPYALALGGDLSDRPDLSDIRVPFTEIGMFGSVRSFTEALVEGFAAEVAA